MDTSEPLDGAIAAPSGDAATTTFLRPAHRVLHIAYFGCASAVLILLALVLPGQSTRADEILLFGAALWALATLARYAWERSQGRESSMVLEPAHVFLVVLACTYVAFGFDLTAYRPRFTPTSPDALPGLLIDAHVYYALVLSYVIVFIVWYAQKRQRLLESALAVQVVLISMMFERILTQPEGVPLLMLSLIGLVLIRARPWDGQPAPVGRGLLWLAIPLGLFVLVALLASLLGEYRYASLTMTGKIIALAGLSVLIADVVREERQRWLLWLAFTAPALTNAALVTFKLLDITRVMGPSFAFGNRYQPVLIVDPNPLGLALALGVLLVVAAAMHPSARGLRWLALPALVLLLPALVVSYSAPALLGLACGLATMIVLYIARAPRREWFKRQNLAAPAAFAAVGLVVIALYAVPGPTREGMRHTLDDPSTGRSRANIWSWTLRDVREHVVLGVGPGYYQHRPTHVPEFAFRDTTKMLERRQLLGLPAGGQWRSLVFTHPHNLTLAVIEGMGIVGIAALLVIAAAVCIAAWRIAGSQAHEDWWFSAIGLAMLVAVFGWSLTSLGDNVALLPIAGWIALGFVFTTYRAHSGDALSLPPWLTARVARLAASAVVLALLVMYVLRPVSSLTAEDAGREQLQEPDVRGALTAFELSARLDPFHVFPIARQGLAEAQLDRIDDARRSLRDAHDRSPSNPLVLSHLAMTDWLAGDLDAAERHLRLGIAADPWQALGRDLYTQLALMLRTQGREDEATALLAEGFWVDAGNAADGAWVHSEDSSDVTLDALYSSGRAPSDDALRRRIFQRIGVYAGALPDAESGDFNIDEVFALMETEARAALDSDRALGIEMLVQIALCQRIAQQHDAARDLLKEAVALDENANFARYALAHEYLALEDTGAAIRELDEVVRVGRASETYDLRVAFAERDLGVIAFREGRHEDAVRAMRAALDDYRWAYLPVTYSTLVAAYESLGQPDEAAKWRRKDEFLNGR